MSEEGNKEHSKYLESYFQRPSVRKELASREEARRLKYGELPLIGGLIIALGNIKDRLGFFAEAEGTAAYKGYKFK